MKVIESIKKYITKKLSESERYAQLAEECNELGKAALKIRRIITPGASPTPITIEAALDNLHEEFADVLVCCEVLPLDWAKIHDIERKKSERWVKRLMERKEREDEKNDSVQQESVSLREQKNKQSKIIHDLTITVDKEILKDWDNPTGFMDGGYKAVWGKFDNYLTVRVKPSMTLEGDDFTEVCLYKDGKEVASTYPDFLFAPICLEYNGEEYHVQLEKECEEKMPELEDYF